MLTSRALHRPRNRLPGDHDRSPTARFRTADHPGGDAAGATLVRSIAPVVYAFVLPALRKVLSSPKTRVRMPVSAGVLALLTS